MNEKLSALEGVREAWRQDGVAVADALFRAREGADQASTKWWLLGVELAQALGDRPALAERWLAAWALADDRPAVRRAMAESLADLPWDAELTALWARVATEAQGKANWFRDLIDRAIDRQRLCGARALMDALPAPDRAPEWGGHVQALWRGEGDEAWAARWLAHLDVLWMGDGATHSDLTPDPAAFGRLEAWVDAGQVAVIEAWRALLPPGAWADWLDEAAQVARWRAGDGLWSPLIQLPASAERAWPRAVQRQALARLALQAEQRRLARR
jgi:hypothetical protein